MSKTHLSLSKEIVIASSILIGLSIMALADVAILVPQMVRVFSPTKLLKNADPIDRDAVKAAIEVVGQ